MAMSPDELEYILRTYGPNAPGDDAQGVEPDPTNPLSRYRGLPKSPDLPSARDQRLMQNNPTDFMLQDYVDRFGLERMQNPSGPPRGYVPMPRPRHPDLDYNNPLGPAEVIPEEMRGNLREQDLQRMINEGMDNENLVELEKYGLLPPRR